MRCRPGRASGSKAATRTLSTTRRIVPDVRVAFMNAGCRQATGQERPMAALIGETIASFEEEGLAPFDSRRTGKADRVVSVAVHADGLAHSAAYVAGRRAARSERGYARHSSADSDARLVAALPVDGRYHVEIHDAYLSDFGDYRIAVQEVAPYPLELDTTYLTGLGLEGPADVSRSREWPGRRSVPK